LCVPPVSPAHHKRLVDESEIPRRDCRGDEPER